jgi:hypothetical protein
VRLHDDFDDPDMISSSAILIPFYGDVPRIARDRRAEREGVTDLGIKEFARGSQ